MATSPQSSFSHYIALFIDVMGQKAVLSKEHNALEPNCLEKRETKELFDASVGKIELLTTTMKDFFDSRSTEQFPGFGIRTQFFSDCMLFYFPIKITTNLILKEKQLLNIFSLFYATSMSQLTFLAEETPLRGGIDLGLGALTSHAGLYGPINYRVDCLEKRVADYPRVAVGTTLKRYIESEEPYFPILCKNLLDMCTGPDGSSMIDFMGPLISSELGETRTKIGKYAPHELIAAAFHFIRFQRDVFQKQATTTPNEKTSQRLYDKYRNLYDYFYRSHVQ